jgi:hypothetical protein
MDSRRLIYAAGYRRAMAEARADLHRMNSELQREVATLRAELDEVRAAFDDLRSVSLARSKAEHELAELHRLREIARARATERDPTLPLN